MNNKPLMPPYGRLGGKSRLKKKIIGYFPPNYVDMTYIEPFFGGGSLFFYKIPSKKEVINDLDKTIYTLMKGFKQYSGFEISDSINDVYTKNKYIKMMDFKPKTAYDKFIRLLVLTKISFYGQLYTYMGNKKTTIKVKTNYQDKYYTRLENTIILNKDYKEIIKKYDSPNSFFYIDPPYSMSKEYGYYEDQYININELFELLKNIKGKFLISYDDDKYTKDLFKDFKILSVNTTYSGATNIESRAKKEILIKNY
jgi:DNA adenine methylase